MPCARRHCPACRRRRLETAIRRALPTADKGLAGPSWWRKARAVPALGLLRGDARANAVKVGYRLALSARPDGSSAPTWEGLMAATGLSRRSVARWIAWWHEQGFLATAEHGSRAADRPEWNLPGQGNHAAVYLLAVPRKTAPSHDGEAVPVTGTPLVSSRREEPSRAREATPAWPLHALTVTRRDERAAACRIAAEAGWAGSERAVGSAVREFLRAGWTPQDVLDALEFAPDGTRWWSTGRVGSPERVARWRMRSWTGRDPFRRARAARRAADASHAARLVAAFENARAAATAVPSWFADARRAAGLARPAAGRSCAVQRGSGIGVL